jgi:hypothetical protein
MMYDILQEASDYFAANLSEAIMFKKRYQPQRIQYIAPKPKPVAPPPQTIIQPPPPRVNPVPVVPPRAPAPPNPDPKPPAVIKIRTNDGLLTLDQ